MRPFLATKMKKSVKMTVHGALIAALYLVLTLLQNVLVPGSTSMAIQFRVSEALCVLALFTPAAVPGLTVGCFLYNLTQGYLLPLDMVVGTAATLAACGGMYLCRKWTVKGYPLFAMLLPALANGVMVGWELAWVTNTPFFINALYVAIGEATVLLSLGTALYYSLKNRAGRIFG